MTPEEVNRLLRSMDRHGIAVLEHEDPSGKIGLTLDGRLHPPIICGQAGRFHLDIACRDRDSEVSFPLKVRRGQEIGVLKIGPLILPVYAQVDGLLPPPLVRDGDIAGYGDALF